MATTSYGTPYVEAADLVSGYPSTSLSLADRVDDISFKGNGINNQTGTTYTLDILDAGKTVTLNNGSAVTVTIPTNTAEAIEIGSVIRFFNKGAGTVTIQPDGGVTLNNGNIYLGQHASSTIVKLDTNTWGPLNTVGSWIAYTPVLTAASGAITSYTSSGAYAVSGSTVSYRFVVEITNKGTASGGANVSLPVNSKAAGSGVFNETAVNGNIGYARTSASGSTVLIAYYNNGNIWTAGNGQVICGTVVYEKA